MLACCLTFGRRFFSVAVLPSLILATGATVSVDPAWAQDEAFFVGDQSSSGPQLPTLKRAFTGVDSQAGSDVVNRYVPKSVDRKMLAAASQQAPLTKAKTQPKRSMAHATGQRTAPQATAEAKPARQPLFARIAARMPWGKQSSDAQATKPTQPNNPPAQATASKSPRRDGAVQPAGFSRSQVNDNPIASSTRGNSVAIRQDGARRGLFSGLGQGSQPQSSQTAKQSLPPSSKRVQPRSQVAKSSKEMAPRRQQAKGQIVKNTQQPASRMPALRGNPAAMARMNQRVQQPMPIAKKPIAKKPTDNEAFFISDKEDLIAQANKAAMQRAAAMNAAMQKSAEGTTAPAVARPVIAKVEGTPQLVKTPQSPAAQEVVPYPQTDPSFDAVAMAGRSGQQRPMRVPNPVPVAKPAVTKPSERAANLLAEAHDDAANAETDSELSTVIQRCRHVLAIDQSPVAIKYSKDLAAWALNKRGELKADAGLSIDAMADFNDALKMDPQRWQAIHNRGVMHAQEGDFAAARHEFNKTIKLNPKYAKAYSNRAALHVQDGNFTAALTDYRKAIQLDPDLTIAHKGRGRVCHMLGKLDESLQHFDAAVMLSPEDAYITACRADLLVDMGRYAQAKVGYRQAIQLDEASATAYRNLAWLQATCPDARFRDGEQAVKNAQKALELSSEADDITLDTLAAAMAAAGHFEDAVATLEKAIQLSPEGSDVEYSERLRLYRSGQAFESAPIGDIRQAGYTEPAKSLK